jgi:hypothetical protein
MTLHPIPLNFLIYEENFLFLFYQCGGGGECWKFRYSTMHNKKKRKKRILWVILWAMSEKRKKDTVHTVPPPSWRDIYRKRSRMLINDSPGVESRGETFLLLGISQKSWHLDALKLRDNWMFLGGKRDERGESSTIFRQFFSESLHIRGASNVHTYMYVHVQICKILPGFYGFLWLFSHDQQNVYKNCFCIKQQLFSHRLLFIHGYFSAFTILGDSPFIYRSESLRNKHVHLHFYL